MTGEPTLFDVGPPAWAQDEHGRRWWQQHQAHPEIGREFVRLTRQWIAANPGQKVGAKAVVEVLRWNTQVGLVVSESEPYRLNNNSTALLARWAMETHPDLRDVFVTRKRLAAA